MTQIYKGGMPTDPDVRKLRQAFPDAALHVGQMIPYGAIERILLTTKRTLRFRIVTNRWRKLVENDSRIIIGVDRGKGFLVLDASQTLKLSNDKLRSANNYAVRSFVLTNYVDRSALSDDEKMRLDRTRGHSAAIIATEQTKCTLRHPRLTD